MARISYTALASGQQGWDATINGNLAVAFDGPFPFKEYATYGALPAAGADNVRCVAALTAEHRLVISNGTIWLRMPTMAAAQADSVAATLAALVIDFNLLLAKLRDTKVMDT